MWTNEERRVLDSLTTPGRIQAFLDGIPYSTDEFYRSPRQVLADRKAHCFDGALFAAAALRYIGYPPILVDLRAVRDDDHILAIFHVQRHYGALAKSNFVGLRFREPVYRSLRELAMSYFDVYYNLDGEKSLREYSMPLHLSRLDALGWMYCSDKLEQLAKRLDSVRHYRLVTEQMISRLEPIDQRSYQAHMLGTDMAGVFVPGKSSKQLP